MTQYVLFFKKKKIMNHAEMNYFDLKSFLLSGHIKPRRQQQITEHGFDVQGNKSVLTAFM